MPEKRQFRRANLLYYLRIRDLDAGKNIGHLVDVSFGGFKMVSKSIMEPGNTYHFEIDLPEEYSFQKSFAVKGRSCWCKTDVNPDYYASGFCFIDLSLENFRLIKMLMQQFELNSRVPCAMQD